MAIYIGIYTAMCAGGVNSKLSSRPLEIRGKKLISRAGGEILERNILD